MAKLDENGHEILDEKPVAMPIGFKRPPTLAEQVQNYVKTALSQHALSQGQESFEEADDFEVGDDFDPSSPYELEFDPELGKEITKEEKAYLDANRLQFDKWVAEKKKAQPLTEEVPNASRKRKPSGKTKAPNNRNRNAPAEDSYEDDEED